MGREQRAEGRGVNLSRKMKDVAEARKYPACNRGNALMVFPGERSMEAQCRWCKAEFIIKASK